MHHIRVREKLGVSKEYLRAATLTVTAAVSGPYAEMLVDATIRRLLEQAPRRLKKRILRRRQRSRLEPLW